MNLRRATAAGRRIVNELAGLREALRSGLIGPMRPRQLIRGVSGIRRYGVLAGMVCLAAARFRSRTALIDEMGPLTYTDLDERSNAIANAWLAAGVRPGTTVAVLARNHRGFLDATFAAAKCGSRIVFLNTDFSGRQMAEVCEREGIQLLVYDEEFEAGVKDLDPGVQRWLAWTSSPHEQSLQFAIDHAARTKPPAPGTEPKLVILTGGTTGTPKGARRSEPASLVPVAGLFGKVPYRGREVTETCAPLFHALGFSQTLLAVGLGSTVVLRRHFDPELTLASIAEHKSTSLIVVPVMLQRLLDVDPARRAQFDHSSIKIIFVAGSQLGAELCTRVMAEFGPVVHNLYGSTEVAYATIATPEDLLAEPGCVGRVVRGATVRILDAEGRPLPPGVPGRIFVANQLQFEGYTGGGSKETVDGLMSTGDLGHFDAHGRLFVDGRDDDMIVSGGENVFPGEIEELVATHAEVVEAAAVGVPDEKFGQRLHLFVVRRPGSSLDEATVQEYVRSNLARFKVPRDVTFIDQLPRTPTGKVVKHKLPVS